MSTSIMAHGILVAALVSLLPSPTLANRLCEVLGSSICSSPFIPGFSGMGDAWFAISDRTTVITKIVTTLQVPEPPDDLTGVIAINTAVENSNVDDPSEWAPETFQAITAAYPAGWAGCGQNSSQWCAFQSEYKDYKTPKQLTGKPSVKDAGYIALQWRYYRDENQLMHTADNNGMLMPANDPPRQFWPKTECQCEAKGTIGAHRYLNTYIRLMEAKPDWGYYINKQNADNTKPYTTDGGKTWMIDRIDIHESYCENTNKCPTEMADEDVSAHDWALSGPNYMQENFMEEAKDPSANPTHDGVKELVQGHAAKTKRAAEPTALARVG